MKSCAVWQWIDGQKSYIFMHAWERLSYVWLSKSIILVLITHKLGPPLSAFNERVERCDLDLNRQGIYPNFLFEFTTTRFCFSRIPCRFTCTPHRLNYPSQTSEKAEKHHSETFIQEKRANFGFEPIDEGDEGDLTSLINSSSLKQPGTPPVDLSSTHEDVVSKCLSLAMLK